MWNSSGTFEFGDTGVVLLSEGVADRRFFIKLAEHHRLPKMDAPWPVDGEKGAPESAKQLFGKDKFDEMLIALSAILDQKPELRRSIKCVIIATDAADSPLTAFRAVKRQVRRARKFPIPDRAFEVKKSATDYPAVVVILIPTEGSGGLETLCIKAFATASEVNKTLLDCQQRYFECSPAKPNELWGAEKRDKGALQCLIAASYEANPSMPTAWAFSSRHNVAAFVDIASDVFKDVVDVLQKIIDVTL